MDQDIRTDAATDAFKISHPATYPVRKDLFNLGGRFIKPDDGNDPYWSFNDKETFEKATALVRPQIARYELSTPNQRAAVTKWLSGPTGKRALADLAQSDPQTWGRFNLANVPQLKFAQASAFLDRVNTVLQQPRLAPANQLELLASFVKDAERFGGKTTAQHCYERDAWPYKPQTFVALLSAGSLTAEEGTRLAQVALAVQKDVHREITPISQNQLSLLEDLSTRVIGVQQLGKKVFPENLQFSALNLKQADYWIKEAKRVESRLLRDLQSLERGGDATVVALSPEAQAQLLDRSPERIASKTNDLLSATEIARTERPRPEYAGEITPQVRPQVLSAQQAEVASACVSALEALGIPPEQIQFAPLSIDKETNRFAEQLVQGRIIARSADVLGVHRGNGVYTELSNDWASQSARVGDVITAELGPDIRPNIINHTIKGLREDRAVQLDRERVERATMQAVRASGFDPVTLPETASRLSGLIGVEGHFHIGVIANHGLHKVLHKGEIDNKMALLLGDKVGFQKSADGRWTETSRQPTRHRDLALS